jgi:hypothetical protein
VLDVERWAELRREHFVHGVSIKELSRRTGLARNTIRVALRSESPPVFSSPERPSKLDRFKDEIHELLRRDPGLPGVRVRELIEPLGFVGGKSIVDDYLREVRPLFERRRTFSGRSIGRVRYATSICGTPPARCRSGMARLGRGTWWSPRLGTPEWVRAR